jgi:hypothetical protein
MSALDEEYEGSYKIQTVLFPDIGPPAFTG